MCFECTKLSRRNFMSLAATGVAAAGLWTVGGALSPGFAKTTLTADEAIAKLKAGNQKYVAGPDLVEVRFASATQGCGTTAIAMGNDIDLFGQPRLA